MPKDFVLRLKETVHQAHNAFQTECDEETLSLMRSLEAALAIVMPQRLPKNVIPFTQTPKFRTVVNQ